MTTERQEEARRRLREAFAAGVQAEAKLSDVIYHAHDYKMHEVHNGFEFDGECDHGYDCDDLASVLLPILAALDPEVLVDALAVRSDLTELDPPGGPDE